MASSSSDSPASAHAIDRSQLPIDRSQLPIDRSQLPTEQRLAASENLDRLSLEQQVALFHEQDRIAVEAVAKVSPQVVAAVRLVTERLTRGGRLIYIGAGTSGRLGVLDSSEIPPTFRAEPELVQGIIAGGEAAMFRAQEGAEDDPLAAGKVLEQRNVGERDVVFGIAAGGTTPFVWGGLRWARERRCGTVFLSCVGPVPGQPEVDVAIHCVTGPEIVTGSTRLKAGTATKLILNTISTLTMVALGKTYGNRMVDLRASNAKLQDRARRLVMDLAGVSHKDAETLLSEAGGRVKVAVAMAWQRLDVHQAEVALSRVGGRLAALQRKEP